MLVYDIIGSIRVFESSVVEKVYAIAMLLYDHLSLIANKFRTIGSIGSICYHKVSI